MALKLIIVLVVGILTVNAIRIIYFALKAKSAAKTTKAYGQQPQNPKMRILCLGDSMGTGVGASQPSKSLFGNLGKDFPEAEIINWSINGATTKHLFDFVKGQELQSYDLVLLLCGGMDIVQFTSLSKLKLILDRFLSFLKKYSRQVVVIVPKSTGEMPIYWFPVSDVLAWRADMVSRLFEQLSKEHGCIPIPVNLEVLSKDKKKYFSGDKSHPNDLGYQLWYDQICDYLKIL